MILGPTCKQVSTRRFPLGSWPGDEWQHRRGSWRRKLLRREPWMDKDDQLARGLGLHPAHPEGTQSLNRKLEHCG